MTILNTSSPPANPLSLKKGKDARRNYQQILTQAGLKADQAVIYEVLLKNGPKKASQLGSLTPFGRSLSYKILGELVEMGLVLKKEKPGRIAVFEADHPLKLKDWIGRRQEQYKNADLVVTGILPKLISDFNLISGMPGIQIYEGLEGARAVLDDSLTARSEICSYIDNESAVKTFPDLNRQYVERRNRAGVKKKLILADTAFVREHAKKMNRQTTEARLISFGGSFKTVLQIYDTKVSYITWDEARLISVIIDNPNIAKMHKLLFAAMWETARPLS